MLGRVAGRAVAEVMQQPGAYFLEPDADDATSPTWGEPTADWVRRSTLPNAMAIRRFLNRSLAHFDPPHAKSLAKRLRHDWQSCVFEIVVGRYLQVLGAEIDPEPRGTNQKRVDFVATFPDGTVSVECVSKRYNMKAQEKMARQTSMATMLDEDGPHDWAIKFVDLPDARSQEEFKPYVSQAEAWYVTLPAATSDGPRYSFRWEGDCGEMKLEALPFPQGTRPNHMGPAVAFFDDSIVRLKKALKDERKREQARGAMPPVLLAVDCPFHGPGADDFDQALFGRAVDHRGFDRDVSVGMSFDPDGIFVTDRDVPFAGVWAFLRMSLAGASDPVLYLNPYQRWALPAAIASHEQRVWTSYIDKTSPSRGAVIDRIGFVEFPTGDD